MWDDRIDGPHLDQAAVCEPILRSLPDWFGIEEAIVQYVQQIASLPTWIARIDGEAVGFLSLNRHNEFSAEVHVMAIRRPWQGRGLGRTLMDRAGAWLRDQGVEYLQVKTLGPSRPDENYDRTRAFYRSVGFRPLEELKTLWNERNPCLIMVKKLE